MFPSQRYCTKCGAANQAQDAFCFACGHPLQATPASPQYPIAGSAASTSTGLLTPNLMLKQRYRILAQVGQGGFGAVYKAEDEQFGNRLLAVKEMSQSRLSKQEITEAAENFKREAHILAVLKHPNLPSIYDHFNEAGRWYLVMDFLEGDTLEKYLQKQPTGHLSVAETLQVGLQLCTVLSYLHTRQPPIIFRDLKPSNIMRTPERNLYLIDFGVARHFKPGQAKDTIAFGSPGYAPPEQYGKVQTTPRSDIYSLGATLHQLLSGNDPSANAPSPFDFQPLKSYVPSIPSELETLIMHMLEMNETKRPASMIAVKQELQRIIIQQSVGQVTIPPPVAQPVTLGGGSLQHAQTTTPSTHQQGGTSKTAAQFYLKAKRYTEALVALDEAIRLDPDNASLFNGKGLALDNLNRHQDALHAYEHAIELNPNFANAYINKGIVLNKLKHSQEALAAFEYAIHLTPYDAPAYDNKGDTLSELKRYQGALAAYEHAIRLDPHNGLYYNDKGLALSDLNRYREALAAFEHAIELNPNFANAYINKGMVLYNLKRYREALVVLDQAIPLDPEKSLISYYKGLVLEKLGRDEEAIQAYNRAIRLDPAYGTTFVNKGNTLVRLRRYEEAIAAYDQALQLDPENSLVFYNKSFALVRLGRYREAIVACDRAIQLDPTFSLTFNNKGYALERLGRYEEALELYKEAERLDPSSTVARSNREKLEKLIKQKRKN